MTDDDTSDRTLHLNPDASLPDETVRGISGGVTAYFQKGSLDESPSYVEAKAPERIGEFRIVGEIGRGGMGIVYEAIQESLGRRVALKILPMHATLNPTALARFRREAEAAGRFDHPGLCGVYGTGIDSGLPYIVMRFIEGQTLGRKILEAKMTSGAAKRRMINLPGGSADERSGVTATHRDESSVVRSDVDRILYLIERSARAMHAAHEAGVVHRDLKPGNIMVTPDGRPVVLDFGLATDLAGNQEGLTVTGDFVGTPAYMAPEQCRGETKSIDRRADIWALGVTLYECLTLTRPFEGLTRDSLLGQIMEKEPSAARSVNAEVSREVDIVIATALEKDADKRYSTAADFAEDLRRVRMREPIRATPVRWPTKLLRWAQRNPATAALVFVLSIGVPTIAIMSAVLLVQKKEVEESRRSRRLAECEAHLEDGYSSLAARMEGDEKRKLDAAEKSFDAALAVFPDRAEALAGKLLVARRRGAWQSVIDLSEEHRSRFVDGARGIMRLRAEAFEVLERVDEAKAETAALPIPSSALDFFLEATVMMEEAVYAKNPDDVRPALEAAERAVVCSRVARPIYFHIWCRAAGFAGDEKAASMSSHALLTLFPDKQRSWFVAAFALQRAGRLEDAEGIYRRAITMDPSDVDALFNHALILDRLGRDVEAEAEYRKILTIDPRDSGTLLNLSSLYCRLGRAADAIALLEPIRARGELGDDIRVVLADAISATGDYESAQRHLDAVLKNDPQNLRALKFLGVMKLRLGEFDVAEGWLRKAVDGDSDDADILLQFGYAKFRSGNEAEGLEIAAKAAKNPKIAMHSLSLYGVLLARSGKTDDAMNVFRRVLADLPDDPTVLGNYGSVLVQAGRWTEAKDVLLRAVEKRPDLKPLHYALSEVFEKLEDADAFEKELKRYEAYWSDDAEGWETLARIEMKIADEAPEEWDKERMIRAAERAVALLEKDHPRPRFVLARCLDMLGRRPEALAAARAALAKVESELASPTREWDFDLAVGKSELEAFIDERD